MNQGQDSTKDSVIKDNQIEHEKNQEYDVMNSKDSNSDHVELTEDDKNRIYKLWNYLVIIKLNGKTLNHIYLKMKLTTLWRIEEDITLIDLGHDYFIVKLLKRRKRPKVFTARPMVH